MKSSAQKHGDNSFQDGEKDEGVGEWMTVTPPENLFKLNIDVNFQLHDHKSLMINDDDTACESVNESEEIMHNFKSYRAIVLNVPHCLTLNPKFGQQL